MEVFDTSESQSNLAKALRQMSTALDMLDDLGVPGEISSHLDLAICRLEHHLGLDTPPADGAAGLYASLEQELIAVPAASELPSLWNSDQCDTVP